MKTIPVSLLVAGMLLPAICLAQAPASPDGPPSGKKRPNGEVQRPFVEAWKRVDVDGDGFLSQGEFIAMPRMQNLPEEKRITIFSRLDKDGNGKLGRDELMRFGRPHEGEPTKRLWELDSDKSGGISLKEFKQGQLFKKLPPERLSALFNRLDTDGDGLITPNDRPEMPGKHLDEKPRKGDGRPGGEGSELQRFERMFEKLDVDGDGSLTFEEFRVGPGVKDLDEDEQEQRFQKLDSDGDHKISIKDCPPPLVEPEMKRN